MSLKEILNVAKEGIVYITMNPRDLEASIMECFKKFYEQMKVEEKGTNEKLLTGKQAAKLLGCDPSTLWRWHRDGYLKHVKIGAKTRYRLGDIKKIMEERL